LKYKEKLIKSFEQTVLEHCKNGLLVPIVDKVFDFEQIAEAHKYMESNANIGKILLKVHNEEKTKNSDL